MDNTSSIDAQRKIRIEKIQKMRELGIEPYPVKSKRDCKLAEVKSKFDSLKDVELTLSGRITRMRGSGKISFIVLDDYSDREGFQVVIKSDVLSEDLNYEKNGFTYKQYKKFINEGDYVQVIGKLEKTISGENSLFASQIKILTKCIRPLPDKMDSENTEERYLNRVADIKMNVKGGDDLSVKDYIIAREKYWRIWREEMINEGFIETYNNMFETKPAGADAKPFTTFYNELESDVYLRMALEIPLKKLVAGGLEKVFEIGRIFRNEGSSPSHLQDYTQIEWYWAYSDYYDAMPFTVRIYRRIAKEILGTLVQTTYKGDKINWGSWFDESKNSENWRVFDGWPAIPYFDAIRYFSKQFYPKGEVDLENKSYDELMKIAKENDIEIPSGTNISNLIDKIYKKVARPFMTNPMFLTEQPVFLEPLAKRSPENKELVHRWQIVAGGAELGKCFSELNDPLDQFDRLQEQQKAKDAGDDEAQFLDEEFVKAMEYGMPPMSGFGMSERLIAFLLGKHIREVMNFPYIKDESITREIQINNILEQKKSLDKRLEKLGHKVENHDLTDNLHEIDPDEIVNHFGEDTILECWTDSYRYESSGKVILCSDDEFGNYVVLDKTIFYPQGGGQPSDIGTISDGINTFEVSKCVKEGGLVKHYGTGSQFSSGTKVDLKIDKEKRLTHISLHSAAHLIDYALSELGMNVEGGKGYHFPAGPYCEYKFDGELPQDLNEKLEEKLLEIQKKKLDLIRSYKKDENGNIIRTIKIDKTNSFCPCSGTHINNTSQISGKIVVRQIKIKKGVMKIKYAVEAKNS